MRVPGGSFNGRTTDSDSVNRGSNPFPPANIEKDWIRMDPILFPIYKGLNPIYFFIWFLAQESRRVTALLKTVVLGDESTGSTIK